MNGGTGMAGPATIGGISVVICTYADARWAALVKAVASVQAQRFPALEIIIVIDHNPALAARARGQFSGMTVLENHGQRGLSGARNSGIAAARGDVIAFLDDDAMAEDDWLGSLADCYTDPDVLGVGGAIEAHWLGGRPGWFPAEFDWVVGCSYRGLPRRAMPVRNVIGANMSFRRELVEAVGGFSSAIGRVADLPAGCEETEFCIRTGQHWPQRHWLYEPAARVVHRVEPERGRWQYFRDRCYAEGRSKAIVARLVGAGDGLASERIYTLKTLPRGVVRSAVAAARDRAPRELLRGAAIIAGLALTTTGYLIGRAMPPPGLTPGLALGDGRQ